MKRLLISFVLLLTLCSVVWGQEQRLALNTDPPTIHFVDEKGVVLTPITDMLMVEPQDNNPLQITNWIQMKNQSGDPTTLPRTGRVNMYWKLLAGVPTLYYQKSDGTVATAGPAPFDPTAPGPIGSVTPSTGAFTSISATLQFTSTVSTGTAPFVIASTTVIPNLNASLLGGATFAAPGTIGGGTPGNITGLVITANTNFAGPLTGNVTGNASGTAANVTGIVLGANGGTGIANSGKTITLGGNLVTSGAFNTTLTVTADTNVTLPTTGTLINSAVTTLSSLASLGTITSGTWNGSVVQPTYGGTGVNNGSATVTLAGNLVTSGANSLTLTTSGATNVTLPTSGTLVNSAVTALTSLASIGTITTGVWNGTAITDTYLATISTAGKVSDSALSSNVPLLNAANTFTGVFTNSTNAASSAPAVVISGTTFSGTGTTATPLVLIRPTGTTAATSWSTNGTVFGINAATGFNGNFLDFHLAGGVSLAKLTKDGDWTANSMTIGSGSSFGFGTTRGYMSATADGVFKFADSANSSFGRLMLGGSTSSFPALKRSTTTVAFRLADDSADAGISASTATFTGIVTHSNAGIVTTQTNIPTIATAGTSATVTALSTDEAGEINIVGTAFTGTTTTTFILTHAAAPKSVVLTATNATAAALALPYISSLTTTTWVVTVTGLTGTASYGYRVAF